MNLFTKLKSLMSTTVEMKAPPKPSSQIIAIGYDHINRELHVQFKGTGTYVYHDVLPGIYKKLLEAESIGKFMAKEIIPNFSYTKIKSE